ncbi:MAG TPA: hypothetical protein VL426_01275 [Candidatus Binatia bacterium]|jgi:ABC-type transporter Mla subunit MlaD|nr:hypothetical protein [Candidatus Binatia bacterium]
MATPNAPQLPPGLTPKPAPSSPQEEEAIVRKAYNDARQHVRTYKKAAGDLGEQRKNLSAEMEKLKTVLQQLAKADAQLATEEEKLNAQTKVLDENLAELKKIVDDLNKHPRV